MEAGTADGGRRRQCRNMTNLWVPVRFIYFLFHFFNFFRFYYFLFRGLLITRYAAICIIKFVFAR